MPDGRDPQPEAALAVTNPDAVVAPVAGGLEAAGRRVAEDELNKAVVGETTSVAGQLAGAPPTESAWTTDSSPTIEAAPSAGHVIRITRPGSPLDSAPKPLDHFDAAAYTAGTAAGQERPVSAQDVADSNRLRQERLTAEAVVMPSAQVEADAVRDARRASDQERAAAVDVAPEIVGEPIKLPAEAEQPSTGERERVEAFLAERPEVARLVKFIESRKREYEDAAGRITVVQRFNATVDPDKHEVIVFRRNPDNGSNLQPHLTSEEFRTALGDEYTTVEEILAGKPVKVEDTVSTIDERQSRVELLTEIGLDSHDPRTEQALELMAEKRFAEVGQLSEQQHAEVKTLYKRVLGKLLTLGDGQGTAAMIKELHATITADALARSQQLTELETSAEMVNTEALRTLTTEAKLAPALALRTLDGSAERQKPIVKKRAGLFGKVMTTVGSFLWGAQDEEKEAA